MIKKERFIITIILFGIFIFVLSDLLIDSKVGAQWWHLVLEGTIALAAIIGIFYLLRTSYSLKNKLDKELVSSEQLRKEAAQWRLASKKYIDGLSHAIDDQLAHWDLTQSEKEITFLLLKGYSLKDIAAVRKTSEKTVRSQATSIYSKSGLSGRSELSAFFLEDLLVPLT